MQLRQARRQLDPEQQHAAAARLLLRVREDEDFIHAERLAFYQATDGEIDPFPLLALALKLGKRCYLPVVPEEGEERLLFAAYESGSPMRPNRYGIPEPEFDGSTLSPPELLDTVFLPLVGFDSGGTRLGMGLAFYDKTFSFLDKRNGHSRANPRLIGLAHEIQRVESLESAPWDIPLDKIITDRKTYPVA